MSRRLLVPLVSVLALAIVATPLLAYTIFLKDGNSIVAKKEPRIEGDRLIITQRSGVETFILLEEVDLEKTKEFNAKNFDGAIEIRGGETTSLSNELPDEKPDLREFIVDKEIKLKPPKPSVRREPIEQAGVARTATGDVDLDSLRRQAYGDLEIVNELRSYFTSQGLEANVFSGSKSTHPMIEVVTSSESAVFKSLEVAAQALPQLRDRHASQITALELLLKTSGGGAAGQFVMTPELATSLNSGETDVPTFFIRHVRF